MLKCIIVDDERLALDLLEDYIRNIPFLQLIGRCSSAMDAVEVIQKQRIDLVFSDIEMQGLSGMQLIKTLTARPMFIIITAYKSYAIEGFELDVIDYLLKPVSYERFVKACNKALTCYNSSQTNAQIQDHVFFHADYSLIKVLLDEILFVEGVKDYVKIHFTTSKRPLLVRHSMKGVEEIFPSSKFIRIHKSYIINATSVTAIRKNSLFLKEVELPVSEQYRDAIALLTNKKL
jgi:two-component system, LytTR family, response regulator